jgi:hypothetical protein
MATEHSGLDDWYATWPPDDTEESIMGSDWHQLTITNLRMGINEIARAEAGAGRQVPFQAVNQTTLLGLKRRGKTGIKAIPDVFIFKKPVDGRRPWRSRWPAIPRSTRTSISRRARAGSMPRPVSPST